MAVLFRLGSDACFASAALAFLHSTRLHCNGPFGATYVSTDTRKRPFGAPASETSSAGHSYKLRHLTNGEANHRAELRIKVSHISESAPSPRSLTLFSSLTTSLCGSTLV
jgi:hypothetical protein